MTNELNEKAKGKLSKKIIALIVAGVLLLGVIVTAVVLTLTQDKGKGPILPVYLSDEIINFDPAYAYDDDAAAKILPLIYEGLTRVDAKGKVVNALMDKYTYEQQPDGTYLMEVTLKESYWSDGSSVSADDFVYAYKRILDPEFYGQSAALLYELKNAREVKRGEKSIDDLGVRSAEKRVLQFIFDYDIDIDAWLETLSSPALVPLREVAVSTQTPGDEVINSEGRVEYGDIPIYAWSTDPTTLITNGEFTVKTYTPASRSENGEMVIERNMYYRRDPIGGEPVTKYVGTYRLKIVFLSDEAQKAYELQDGEQEISREQLASLLSFDAEDKLQSTVFNSNLSLVPADKVEKEETVDTLTQHVYYFNTENELFADANVRKALSLAIDREHITTIVRNTTASTGWVPDGIFSDSKRKDDYRETYGDILATGANIDEAKNLLKSAGVSGGEFELSVRDSAVELAIAEYVKSVWDDLGFDVKIVELGKNDDRGIDGSNEYTSFYHLYRDELSSALIKGEFDVIALDYTSMSTYAFASLAPFATGFTGRAISLRDLTLVEGYNADLPHITGWQNDSYDELIEKAFAEKDLGARSAILADAEKILLDEMPVMPLVQYQNSYIKSNALSKITTDYYGAVHFDNAKLKDAELYAVVEED